MSARYPIVLAAIVGLLPLSGGAQQTTATPKFRSSTSVVSVSAVVRDRKGRFVRDLDRKDFVVAEAGQHKPILDFRAQSDGPVKVALLFDISGSMQVGTRAQDSRAAAMHIVSALRPNDEAAVFAFDTGLDYVHKFSSDFPSVLASFEHVDRPYGQTSLYDAIAETAKAVAAERDAGGTLLQRRAVVVLTDGIDTRSRLTAAEVTSIASSIDIPVYVVAVMAPMDEPGYAGREEESPIRNLAHWTGGDLFYATVPAHASITARRIVDELRHQYVLAVEASARPGWHPLEIQTRNRNLVVRARAGYTAGGAVSP